MLTKKTYKGLGAFFKVAALFKFIPYDWDPQNHKLILTKKSFSRLLPWYTLIVLILLHAFTSLHTFFTGYFNKTRGPATLTIDVAFGTAYLAFAVFHFNSFRHKHNMRRFLNSFLALDNAYSEKYSHVLPPRKTDGCDHVIDLFTKSLATSPMASLILFLENTDNPRYPLNWIIPVYPKPYWVIGLYSLYEYAFAVSVTGILFLYMFIILAYTKSTNFWLRFLCKHSTKSLISSSMNDSENVSLAHGIQAYKKLQILNISFNYIFSRWFWPAFLAFNISGNIATNFSCIKFHNALPPSSYAVFPMFSLLWISIALVLYPVLGRVNGYSENFKDTCKHNSFTPLGKREVRALRSLGIRVSSVYNMKKTTVLFIMMTIINFTVNFVIML